MKTITTFAMAAFASISMTLTGLADLALDGYCPVCYIAAGKAVQGVEKFQVDHDGDTYYFVNEGAMKTFEADPEKFLPEYDGLCAYGVSIGKKLEADPTLFSVIDGKIYLNFNKDVKKKFDADQAGFVKKADEKWEMISKEMAK